MTSEREHLLDDVQRLEADLAAARLTEQTDSLLASNLTVQQLRALMFVVHRSPLTTGDLAHLLKVAPNVATGIIQRLVERELISRSEDEHDRRVKLLVPTALGRTLLGDVQDSAKLQRRALLENLDDAQLDALRSVLAVLSEAASASVWPAYDALARQHSCACSAGTHAEADATAVAARAAS
ncbi:DNA-binding MarR family transcriptional regulator [Cellulomonas sp. PhB143]|nr:DNA-binding MarR family transcriptional regulator [Cellulomonas sp. PhB143]